MPKVVDPVERRLLLAEAVWRVVRRDGLENASVRNVAREAGLSMGSLRHYFSTQSELLAFALQAIIDRIETRIAAIGPENDPRRRAELVLAEVLPMDADRRAENEVWLAYTARATVDPALRAMQDSAYDQLRAGCGRIVRQLAGETLTRAEAELETERLHALIDGLAVHAAMRPDLNSPERLRAIVARHLDELESARP